MCIAQARYIYNIQIYRTELFRIRKLFDHSSLQAHSAQELATTFKNSALYYFEDVAIAFFQHWTQLLYP